MKALIAQKIGMTQVFSEKGTVIPVTLLLAGPCVVTQVKTDETDGYSAVQLGYGEAKKLAKPQVGHVKKSGATPKTLSEFRIEGEDDMPKVGDSITAEVFSVGDTITVSGVSKGKGFAGTIKRHNFARGPKTHGSHNYRAPGSIGAGYPQHVFKGQKMAGHMGNAQVTTKNLTVAHVDAKNNIIGIKGAIPGPKKSIVRIWGIA
ncbi:MAG: 50S ribosomal protein L3 [Candidatus Saccharibacteria bacterium]